MNEYEMRLKKLSEFSQPFEASLDAVTTAKSREDIDAVLEQLESERKELVNQIGAAQRYLSATGGKGKHGGQEVGERIEALKEELTLRDDLLYQTEEGLFYLATRRMPLMKLLKKTERRQKLQQI